MVVLPGAFMPIPTARFGWGRRPKNSYRIMPADGKAKWKKGSNNYQDGIAEHPVEILTNAFVAHIGPEVSD
jgi:hypothetical protein